MSLYRGLRSIATASGDGLVDWDAVTTSAQAVTTPGTLHLTGSDRQAYASDVRAAHERIRTATGLTFPRPETVQIQNRYHWIDANAASFQRIMLPLEQYVETSVPDLARSINTASMSVTLAFLARNVLGQYDPLLMAEQPSETSQLYFVHPNIQSIADELDVPFNRFRRWIAFHEVTHAAEFAYAPWLSEHLIDQLTAELESMASGGIRRPQFDALQRTMTAVEGYADLLMDRAFDAEYTDLRAKLDARRQNAGPISLLLRRVLGLDMKRQQYERGRVFFETIVESRDLETATRVWEAPEQLPTEQELKQPTRWLDRIEKTN